MYHWNSKVNALLTQLGGCDGSAALLTTVEGVTASDQPKMMAE